MSEKYYRLLDLPYGASLEEIKRAYRRKAKELHPDRNSSPNAHEDFIHLTEACEYLVALKEGVINTANDEEGYSSWSEEARNRARHYSRMSYEDFINSHYYKEEESYRLTLDILGTISAIAAIVIVFAHFSSTMGKEGVLLSTVIDAIIAIGTWISVKELRKASWDRIKEAVKFSWQDTFFRGIPYTIFNFYTFFWIDLQTLIPITAIIGILAGGVIVTNLSLTGSAKENSEKKFISLCIAPAIINSFFLINFLFSNNPKVEKYAFELESRHSHSRYSAGSVIHLQSDKYEEYPGIRTFFNPRGALNKDSIIYTMKDGLFGLKVMKKYRFE